MKTKLIVTALFAQVAALTGAAATADAAERWRYEIDARQNRHLELISEGRVNGMLTWRETRQLRGEQFRISNMKRVALADGRLDWTERQSIRYAQDAANEHIFAERNDGERRRWW